MKPSTPDSKREVVKSERLNLINFFFFSNSQIIKKNHFSFQDFNEQCPYSLSPVSIKSQKLLRSPRKATRKISRIPFKVLDAPELQDDFYLNLVDWSAQNVLAVGLGSCVYLWSACTSQVSIYDFTLEFPFSLQSLCESQCTELHIIVIDFLIACHEIRLSCAGKMERTKKRRKRRNNT